MADGDGRYLLNMAEQIFTLHGDGILDPAGLAQSLQKRAPLYDKGPEEHYNLISALHTSMRGSDRSEARRVCKACVITCSSLCSPYLYTTNSFFLFSFFFFFFFFFFF